MKSNLPKQPARQPPREQLAEYLRGLSEDELIQRRARTQNEYARAVEHGDTVLEGVLFQDLGQLTAECTARYEKTIPGSGRTPKKPAPLRWSRRKERGPGGAVSATIWRARLAGLSLTIIH